MQAVAALIDFFSILVVVTVVVSWIGLDARHPVSRVLDTLVEPVLRPVRRIVPPLGGLDLTPMLVLVALKALQRALLAG